MRAYKNWILILYFATLPILLIGCAAFQKQLLNYEDCMADPACLAQVQNASTTTTGVAGIVSNAFANPISIPITALVGLLSTLLAGVWYGSKKNKPKAP